MKKILFNDKYGLTQAVLDGRKTQTRRITCNDLVTLNTGYKVVPEEIFCKDGIWYYRFKNGHTDPLIKSHLPRYKVDEVVAVAQNYHYCDGFDEQGFRRYDVIVELVGTDNKGWDNKMFVRADLMPHQIRITNVRIQRLQDISDNECLKEGLEWDGAASQYYVNYQKETGRKTFLGNTTRKAFARLIDKVSWKGTWDSNPYVWVYDFELIK